MEYTVRQLASLAGISTRTLRYYDEIGLLKPARVNSSGYRVYGQVEVDRLQQVLFYRELGVSLNNIRRIVTADTFDRAKALKEHRENLFEKRRHLDRLIANVDKTIASIEGRINMTDKEKFEAFKQKMIEENERKYGEEVRRKYGRHTAGWSNDKVKNMTKEEFDESTRLAEELMTTLSEAFEQGDPASALAQKAADLHRQWLSYFWGEYKKEAHAGLARMYVDDERFRVQYDRDQPGKAAFFRDAILIYTGQTKL